MANALNHFLVFVENLQVLFAITGFIAVFTKCPEGSALEEVGPILFAAFFDSFVLVPFVAIF